MSGDLTPFRLPTPLSFRFFHTPEIVITKRGKPVAKLVPIVDSPPSFIGSMKGTMEIIGDIVAPIDVRWNADE